MTQQKAIIIGAGPAGLTAAYELIDKTDIKPIIYEMTDAIGGISQTINYKGYRMDIGGHRFFSKSDVVMNWWLKIMPMETVDDQKLVITYHHQQQELSGKSACQNPEQTDLVMLVRNRKSRIFWMRKLFDYPIQFNKNTIANLGLIRTLKILLSYLKVKFVPIKNEQNLEQFFINRFGNVLYRTFFKSYTEKVWGEPCTSISAEWGSQRIKGLSISKTIQHIFKQVFRLDSDSNSIAQKNIETSLIERFLYPKYGPGQLWEEVAKQIQETNGEVHLNRGVNKLFTEGNKIIAVEICNQTTGETEHIEGDYFFSTMPVRELIRALQADIPDKIRQISEGLIYRDFITVGLLVKKLAIKDQNKIQQLIKDNWIYVQEPDVLLGRIQIFNNWSPYLVKDTSKVWLGLEYFCYDTDKLWQMSAQQMTEFAIDELTKIGFITKDDILDSTVVKVPKTYPAYFGTYDEFNHIKDYVDRFENLYLIGRNGMHKYNNQDHSMLTAIAAVDNVKHGITDKSNIWAVNTEQTYHEAKDDK